MATSTNTEHRDHHHHYGRPALPRPQQQQQQHHYAYKIVSKKQRSSSAGGKKKSTGNRRRRLTHVLAGIVLGLFVGYTFGGSYGRFRLYAGCGGGDSDGSRSHALRPLQPLQQSSQVHDDDDNSGGGGARPMAGHGGAGGPPESLLFVGVMTANRYLATRAVAVHGTWARRVPGRVMFYSSETSVLPPGAADLPLVRLPTVDDSYPPQKKSFLMLQHMWDNYGGAYEWFMRADDDVYVRPDRLAALLRSVDSRKPVFIGQAGRGNQEEFGLLSLEYDENFCMGGPGVIMSRETLARVVPHIKHCLKNLFTTHEDVELGRCVQKYAGVSCTWSYEMQTILYHNSSGRDAFTGNLKQKEVHRAITLHPVKQHTHMYRIHNYMKGLELREIQQKKILLHRDVRSMIDQLMSSSHPRPSIEFRLTGDSKQLFASRPGSPNYLGDPDLLGLPPGLNKYRPRKVADVIKWDFISKAWYSDTDVNPRRRIDSYTKEGLDDVVREVMDLINKFSKQRGRVIDFKEIFYGYQRVNPLFGVDYMLDMLLMYKKYRGKKMTVPVRRHAYLQQQFTGFEVREVLDGSEVKLIAQQQDAEAYDNDDDDTAGSPSRDIADNGMVRVQDGPPAKRRPDSQTKTVHFVLPLFNRLATFARFVDNYESVCLANDERVTLTVVPFGQATVDGAAAAVAQLASRYPDARLTVLPDPGIPFARAAALHAGAVHAAGRPPDDLLFFVDVDMLWTAATLDRVRLNTVRGRTAYFPIVYSEYDPVVVYARAEGSPNHFLVNQDTGYWRQYGFGIVSAYATDLAAAGGLNTSIRGWGNEDVDLYEKFVRSRTAASVFRAADPDLVHVYHPVECDAGLPEPKARMCANTRFETYGNVDQFANIIYRNRDAVYDFAAGRLQNGSTAAVARPLQMQPASVSAPRPRV